MYFEAFEQPRDLGPGVWSGEGATATSQDTLPGGAVRGCVSALEPSVSDAVALSRGERGIAFAERGPVGQRCGGAFFAELQFRHVCAGVARLALGARLVPSRWLLAGATGAAAP